MPYSLLLVDLPSSNLDPLVIMTSEAAVWFLYPLSSILYSQSFPLNLRVVTLHRR